MTGFLLESDEEGELTDEELKAALVDWSRSARVTARNDRLKPRATELDIRGLKNCGEYVGYIGILEMELRCPSGCGMKVMTDEENEKLRAEVLASVTAEMQYCTQRLSELEQSPAAVEQYISDLRHSLWFLVDEKNGIRIRPEEKGPLADLVREDLAKMQRNIDAHTAEIAASEALRKKLRHGKAAK